MPFHGITNMLCSLDVDGPHFFGGKVVHMGGAGVDYVAATENGGVDILRVSNVSYENLHVLGEAQFLCKNAYEHSYCITSIAKLIYQMSAKESGGASDQRFPDWANGVTDLCFRASMRQIVHPSYLTSCSAPCATGMFTID